MVGGVGLGHIEAKNKGLTTLTYHRMLQISLISSRIRTDIGQEYMQVLYALSPISTAWRSSGLKLRHHGRML